MHPGMSPRIHPLFFQETKVVTEIGRKDENGERRGGGLLLREERRVSSEFQMSERTTLSIHLVASLPWNPPSFLHTLLSSFLNGCRNGIEQVSPTCFGDTTLCKRVSAKKFLDSQHSFASSQRGCNLTDSERYNESLAESNKTIFRGVIYSEVWMGEKSFLPLPRAEWLISVKITTRLFANIITGN